MRLFALMLLILTSSVSMAESLWDSDSGGYITAGRTIQIGQFILVTIDYKSGIKLSSVWTDSGTATIEFTGGETQGLFDFLPTGSAQTSRSLKGETEAVLDAEIAARVRSLDDTGAAFVRGEKSRVVGGNTERITVSGWVSPSDIDDTGRVAFDSLADSIVEYRTFNETGAPVISQEDFASLLEEVAEYEGFVDENVPQAAALGATAEQPALDAVASTQPEEGTATTRPTTRLNTEAKRRLLLAYLNRFLSLLFESTVDQSAPADPGSS